MALALKDGDRFIFMGDSITDCGRRNEGTPQGMGYAAITQGLILAKAPALQVTYWNKGIGGDTTVELENRWQADVLDLKPTWMSVLVGINDCFQYLGGRAEVGPEEYAVRYEGLLQKAVDQTGCRLVLLEPFLFLNRAELTERERHPRLGPAPAVPGDGGEAGRAVWREADPHPRDRAADHRQPGRGGAVPRAGAPAPDRARGHGVAFDEGVEGVGSRRPRPSCARQSRRAAAVAGGCSTADGGISAPTRAEPRAAPAPPLHCAVDSVSRQCQS